MSVAVSVAEPHHVVQMELSGADRGHAQLYDFGAVPRIEPPDAAHVAHVDDLAPTRR